HPKEDYNYSFLGFFPYLTYEVKEKNLTLTIDGKPEQLTGDVLKHLWRIARHEIAVGAEILPSSLGGLIGFISYDAVRLWEKIPVLIPDFDNCPDLLFQAYHLTLCFDHKRSLLTLGIVVDPLQENYEKSIAKLDSYFLKLSQSKPLPSASHSQKGGQELVE